MGKRNNATREKGLALTAEYRTECLQNILGDGKTAVFNRIQVCEFLVNHVRKVWQGSSMVTRIMEV